ncbi:DeoR family transcriptional regulator [Altererythrobacter sp. H2]|uniref:DeoR family transcriptional regulator n=1 Tax=Altererythrobacter sp. H2 TaxID=3108391 RepID=UPI002B4C15E6|nr:DeoR family transcriptional regulator [Altererythrobacter sp. H2]WRK95827.1 DeoR family transcriptional regulator [Altererythrobacter sp. H2]
MVAAAQHDNALARISNATLDPVQTLTDTGLQSPLTEELNERQHWFLARVGAGERCRAEDICAYWKVSPKTARRDIAALRSAGLVMYTGARRNGRYRFIN